MTVEKFKCPLYKNRFIYSQSSINDPWILDMWYYWAVHFINSFFCLVFAKVPDQLLEQNFSTPVFHLVMYCNYLATSTNTESIHIVSIWKCIQLSSVLQQGGSYSQSTVRMLHFLSSSSPIPAGTLYFISSENSGFNGVEQTQGLKPSSE